MRSLQLGLCAIPAHQPLRVQVVGRDAGRGGGLVVVELVGDGDVEVEQLGQEVGVGVEVVGGEGGGVDGGVGGLQFVAAGQFEGAVEGSQGLARRGYLT